MIRKALVTLAASYYNPFVSRWEPFIEKVGLDFEWITSKNKNPKFLINLQLGEEFKMINLNFSFEMVYLFLINNLNTIFC